VANRLEGKTELTWTNKHLRLITHEDPAAKPPYAWVRPSDFRVAETRLLTEVARVGDPDASNLLIRGDALHALAAMSNDGAGVPNLTGKVRLAYIDPPFNTGKTFAQYEDNLEKSIWLTMMRDRLRQIQVLLDPTGSVWVHCDDSMMAPLRILMDEIFLADNFLATVIWEKADSPRMDAKGFSTRHDFIIVFGASSKTVLHRRGNGEVPAHYTRVAEDGRRFYLKPLRAMGGQGSTRAARPKLWFPMIAPDGAEVWPMLPDGGDGCWRWNQAKVKKDADLIEWVEGKKGWQPYFRIFAKPDAALPPETIWLASEVGSNRTSKNEVRKLLPDIAPFDTPKPEALLRRIIETATQPGDFVLDCFAGSGATAATAHKLRRRWATVEISRDTVEHHTLPRLTKVVNGEDPGGISEDADWEGGGGFSVLDIVPSMFEVEGDTTLLADWATGGALSEAVAAQLGFPFELDGPFCGRKGRTRLAVIDGLVNTDVADLLLGHLAERDVLMLCGTGMDPAVQEHLTRLRPGSVAQLIPQAILGAYGRPRRWTPAVARQENAR
jgi:adenine-specific DNA-methyltransferase